LRIYFAGRGREKKSCTVTAGDLEAGTWSLAVRLLAAAVDGFVDKAAGRRVRELRDGVLDELESRWAVFGLAGPRPVLLWLRTNGQEAETIGRFNFHWH